MTKQELVKLIFICNTKDMRSGLTQHRTNGLVAVAPESVEVRVTDGEAWWQTKDLAVVRGWLERYRVHLGISKRRILSDEAQEARRDHARTLIRRGTGPPPALPMPPPQNAV